MPRTLQDEERDKMMVMVAVKIPYGDKNSTWETSEQSASAQLQPV
jgi:hypothetical protein